VVFPEIGDEGYFQKLDIEIKSGKKEVG